MATKSKSLQVIIKAKNLVKAAFKSVTNEPLAKVYSNF